MGLTFQLQKNHSVKLQSSLVDVSVLSGLPGEQLVVSEPQVNLTLGRVVRVASVNDVAANINTEIA